MFRFRNGKAREDDQRETAKRPRRALGSAVSHAPQVLRALVRADEIWLLVVAAGIGVGAGLSVWVINEAAQLMHQTFFGISPEQRLSAMYRLSPVATVLVPCVGGLVLGLVTLGIARIYTRRSVDPIEANALFGGRMSLTGSLVVVLQTIISNGVGASIGLEAAYTQIGSALASKVGHAFRVRRNDMRLLVGCGAAAAIAGAFNAPLTGAFYAFELVIGAEYTLPHLLLLVGLKAIASAISIGSGFRGGLFFASLFLGSVLGKAFALVVGGVSPEHMISPTICALVGMSGLAVAIIGGPLTMGFLALESTGSLPMTVAVLAACIVSAVTVRRTFGYSFATWRFHLRGESIRSAVDIGWMRNLTVERMMRREVRTIHAGMPLADFKHDFSLGSEHRVVVLDDAERYVGIVQVAEVYADADDEHVVGDLLHHADIVLLPKMTIKEAVAMFENAESDALAVVDGPESRHVIGLLTEQHALRRYSEELDRRRRELSGE